ncbi:MAG TPA: hypothetical protein PL185_04300 [Flavobacteriales bacterium]|nr:hypothetical protein [Flavobacteriales bacterium]HPH81764.1 hypothetical protein [Flavobacteriales bacterium]
MLNRLLLFPILFLYLFSTVGIRMQAHYCHGEFSSVSLNPFHQLSCACESEVEESNCCTDAQFLLQVKDSYANSTSVSIPNLQAFTLLSECYSLINITSTSDKVQLVDNRKVDLPPPDTLVGYGQWRI